MEKYDIVLIIHFPEGPEIALARDVNIPLADMIKNIKANAGSTKITWTAWSRKKQIIDSGTINPNGEED